MSVLTCPYSGKEYDVSVDNSQRGASIIVKCTDHEPNAHGKRAENRIVLYYDERGVQKIRWATNKEAEKEWIGPPLSVRESPAGWKELPVQSAVEVPVP